MNPFYTLTAVVLAAAFTLYWGVVQFRQEIYNASDRTELDAILHDGLIGCIMRNLHWHVLRFGVVAALLIGIGKL